MKVPDFIAYALQRRCTLTQEAIRRSLEIEEWLNKNGIEIDEADRTGGVNANKNPLGSMENIIKAIEEK